MKSSRDFLFLILLLAPVLASSQTVQWSAPMTDDKKFPYLRILGTVEEGYYLLRSNMTFGNDKSRSGFRSRKYVLQLISDDLRIRFSQPLDVSCEDCHIADVG